MINIKRFFLLLFIWITWLNVYSKTIELNQTIRYNDPYLVWDLISIESDKNNSYLKLKVRNVAKESKEFNLFKQRFDKIIIYTPDNINGFIATTDYSYTRSTIYLSPDESSKIISLKITYPNLYLQDSFKISVGEYGNTFTINIPHEVYKWEDFSKQLMTWDEFYKKNHRQFLTYEHLDLVVATEEEKFNDWLEKGEFETTQAWKERTSVENQRKYLAKIKQQIEEDYNRDVSEIEKEYISLQKRYEDYKKSEINKYYDIKKTEAEYNFAKIKPELMAYDADNQTFLIKMGKYGDILLPVDIEVAPDFKWDWSEISYGSYPEFIPDGEDVSLSRIIFPYNDRNFVYDSNTKARYSLNDPAYDFSPVKIAALDISGLNFDTLVTPDKDSPSELATAEINPSMPSQLSDIDLNIPLNPTDNSSTTFAVIIANEDYTSVPGVPFALNDGKVFSKYLSNSIGIPEKHIKVYNNATLGSIHSAMKYIDDLSHAYGKNLNLIFYYAGHGMPDEKTRDCLLIPVDGDSAIPESCYPVENLYISLANLDANSIIIFMDACFSGSLRGDGMLRAARGVKLRSNNLTPKGKMVVFSAAQGDETAYPLEKEGHGLFTYFLLKKLQESNGETTLGELGEYIVEEVKRESIVSNGKLQTPMVQVSPLITDSWKYWKLNKLN